MRDSRKRRNGACSRSTIVQELTREDHPYTVELAGHRSVRDAYRRGHNWYLHNGEFIARSAELIAIRIPARRT